MSPDCLSYVLQANKSFFSEIIASISDITFSKDGRFILSRDYMTLKLWDINKESSPVATYNVHEQLRARVRSSSLLKYQGSIAFLLKMTCLAGPSGTYVVHLNYFMPLLLS
jgi:WD40 repeat protein